MKSRVTKAMLAALVAGWRGSFLGEKPSSVVDGAIRTSRRWAVAHHVTLKRIDSYGEDVGKDMMMRTSTNKMGRFGVKKSPA
jgi:hypothetical protein